MWSRFLPEEGGPCSNEAEFSLKKFCRLSIHLNRYFIQQRDAGNNRNSLRRRGLMIEPTKCFTDAHFLPLSTKGQGILGQETFFWISRCCRPSGRLGAGFPRIPSDAKCLVFFPPRSRDLHWLLASYRALRRSPCPLWLEDIYG